MSYAVDIDDVKVVIPELTPHIAKYDEEESKPSTGHQYESALGPMIKARKPTPDNARKRTESAQSSGSRGPRCKENEIYGSNNCYDETELTGRRYTGYSCASTADSPSPIETYEGFYFVNPLSKNITDDDDLYAQPYAPNNKPRENEVYDNISDENWKTRTASSAFTVEGVRNIHGQSGIKKPKQSRRWTLIIGVILTISCAAFALACLAYLNSNKALSNGNQLGNANSQRSSLVDGKTNANKTDQKSTVSPFDEVKQETFILFQNFSKLLQRYNALKKKVEQDNLRFSKMNVSFWEQLKSGVFRGPSGHNGTRGRIGAQGKQGPRGMSIRNYTCQYGNSSVTNTDRKKTVIENETARKIFYDVSCESSIVDASHDASGPKVDGNSYRYECTCIDNKRQRSRKMTCIMKYVVCTQW